MPEIAHSHLLPQQTNKKPHSKNEQKVWSTAWAERQQNRWFILLLIYCVTSGESYHFLEYLIYISWPLRTPPVLKASSSLTLHFYIGLFLPLLGILLSYYNIPYLPLLLTSVALYSWINAQSFFDQSGRCHKVQMQWQKVEERKETCRLGCKSKSEDKSSYIKGTCLWNDVPENTCKTTIWHFVLKNTKVSPLGSASVACDNSPPEYQEEVLVQMSVP